MSGQNFDGSNATTAWAVGDSLDFSWDPLIIFMSYVVAVQAAYVTMLITQLRLFAWMVVLAALNLSVAGIWSMHFVGMGAVRMHVDIELNVWLTTLSALAAFAPCTCGLLIVHYKVKPSDLAGVDPLSVRAQIDALRVAPHHWLLCAAVMIAGGVCSMHYSGMHALETSAAFHPRWGIIVASVFIALFAATAALYFAFILPLTRHFALPTALVAGVAVCGMHYTGMYGMEWVVTGDTLVTERLGTNAVLDLTKYIILGSTSVATWSLAFASCLYRKKIQEAAERMQNAVTAAGTVAESLAHFNLEGAERYLSGAVLPDDVRSPLETILANLHKYRPYLPDALFAEMSDMDEQGELETRSKSSISYSRSHSGSTPSSSSGRPSQSGRASQLLTVIQAVLTQKVCTTLSLNFKLDMKHDGDHFVRKHSTLLAVAMKTVRQLRGSFDRFEGEKFCASFNAFKRSAMHADAAVRAALRIIAHCERYSYPKCVAGVASGQVHVGTLGTTSLLCPAIVGGLPKVAAQASKVASLIRKSVVTSALTYRDTCLTHKQEVVLHNVVMAGVDMDAWEGREAVLYVLLSGEPGDDRAEEWMYQLQGKQDPGVEVFNRVALEYHLRGRVAAEDLLATLPVVESEVIKIQEAIAAAGKIDFTPTVDLATT